MFSNKDANKNPENININIKNNENSKDKFSILTDKISSLSENKKSKNFNNIIENKIIEVKDNFRTNIASLEQKYNILNSQMNKFSQIIEQEKIKKEKNKINKEIELKELEQDIKNMLLQERDFMKSYIDDYSKKIEEIIINYSQEEKEENETIKVLLMKMKKK